MGSLEFAQRGERLECTLTVDSHDLGDVTLDECGLATTAGITAYGKERTLTVDSIQTMLGGMFVQPLLAQYAPLGIKGVLAILLPSLGGNSFAGVTEENLDAALWDLITGILPQDIASGFKVSVKVLITIDLSIYYNPPSQRIEAWRYKDTGDAQEISLSLDPDLERAIARAFSPRAIEASDTEPLVAITADSLSAFLEKLYAEVDADALSEDGQQRLLSIVDMLVKTLIESPVDEAPHSLLDLVDFCYQAHLRGDEKTEGWVETAIEGTPALLSTIVASGVNSVLSDATLTDLTTGLSLDLTSLLVKTDNGLSGLAVSAVAGMAENAQDLLDTLTGTLGVDLGSTLAGLLTDLSLFGQPVPALAQNALSTLAHDDNVATDHDFSLDATATLPSDPGGDEDVVDKSELQEVIDQAEDLELAGASQAALDRYHGALAAALRLMSDPNATEAQVAEAEADLAAAIEAVEKSKPAQGGNSGNDGQGGSGGNGSLPKTDDPTNAAAAVVATALGGAALAAGLGARMRGGLEE
ncbi:MAG: hypothetical protein Q4B91_01855 [Atopobiaceae bacterium]|nr:hypothetical protein [Atopobiaceae bacterium]